jgi:AraC family transcriptional regulator
MVPFRLVDRPSFYVTGKKTWISGQDNSLFGHFWQTARNEGLFGRLEQISAYQPGPQTGGVTLGISRVEANPALREFYYMIAVECPPGEAREGLEIYQVPECTWAVFECRGPVPDSIVEAEIFAFSQWLPASGCVHANAPEMEVYLPESMPGEPNCEFWLPVHPR